MIFGERRTYPYKDRTQMVPTFTAVQLTGKEPGYAPAVSPLLRHRPSQRPARPD